MHDNQQADLPARAQANPAPTFALADHRVVSLCGRDAVAFAQSQFMNDVNAITNGHWQWNGWLSPKGRVIALFALLRIDDETVWLLLPDADPVLLVAALQRFVFRSKVALAARADLGVSGAFDAPAGAAGARFGADNAAAVELDLGGEGGPRRLRIAAGDAADDDPALVERWTVFDLMHGLPRLPGSEVEQWTPQQLSLERLAAFSVKKGCYPGQEIVARTHFLGKAKRGLALLEAGAPLVVGADVRDGDAVLGRVIASASDAGRHLGLAVLPKEHAAPTDAGGVAVREVPIGDGLAR